jgi:hypothetical protein
MIRYQSLYFALGIWVCLFAGTLVGEEFDKEGLEFFARKIQPLLRDRCYKCHSEKAVTVEGDLYVDSREGLLTGGDHGPAIEPGKPSQSLLIQAVRYEMDDLKMPPDKRLEDQQIADLEKWIKLGAPAPPRSARHVVQHTPPGSTR